MRTLAIYLCISRVHAAAMRALIAPRPIVLIYLVDGQLASMSSASFFEDQAFSCMHLFKWCTCIIGINSDSSFIHPSNQASTAGM